MDSKHAFETLLNCNAIKFKKCDSFKKSIDKLVKEHTNNTIN